MDQQGYYLKWHGVKRHEGLLDEEAHVDGDMYGDTHPINKHPGAVKLEAWTSTQTGSQADMRTSSQMSSQAYMQACRRTHVRTRMQDSIQAGMQAGM